MIGRDGGALRIVLATAILALIAIEPASAHHPMGGEAPQTMWHGLLSGLGHPVIGPDHLAFIVGIGLVGAIVPGGFFVASAFVAASMGGVLLHLAGLPLPFLEPAVAATVLVAGLVVACGADVGARLWIGLAAIAGALHGYAYGEAVLGTEMGTVGAYLVGLAVVQLVIATGVAALARVLLADKQRASRRLTGAGICLSVLGAVLVVGALVQA